MISAETATLPTSASWSPSPASRTSPSVIVSPASPASFSTAILSPAATRYCLPPVRTTANMVINSVSFCCLSPGRPRTNDKKGAQLGTGKCAAVRPSARACQRLRQRISPVRTAGKPCRAKLRRTVMRFNRALLLLPFLAACASPGEEYPSLALREAERATGSFEPAPPEPYVPPPPPAAVLDRLDALAAEAARAHR